MPEASGRNSLPKLSRAGGWPKKKKAPIGKVKPRPNPASSLSRCTGFREKKRGRA